MLVAKANKGRIAELVLLTPFVAADAALLVLVMQECNASLARHTIAADAKILVESAIETELDQSFQNQQLHLKICCVLWAYINKNEEVNNRADNVAETAIAIENKENCNQKFAAVSKAAGGKKKVNQFGILARGQLCDWWFVGQRIVIHSSRTQDHLSSFCQVWARQRQYSDVVFVKSKYDPMRVTQKAQAWLHQGTIHGWWAAC